MRGVEAAGGNGGGGGGGGGSVWRGRGSLGSWVMVGSVSAETDFEWSPFWDREPVGGLRGQG